VLGNTSSPLCSLRRSLRGCFFFWPLIAHESCATLIRQLVFRQKAQLVSGKLSQGLFFPVQSIFFPFSALPGNLVSLVSFSPKAVGRRFFFFFFPFPLGLPRDCSLLASPRDCFFHSQRSLAFLAILFLVPPENFRSFFQDFMVSAAHSLRCFETALLLLRPLLDRKQFELAFFVLLRGPFMLCSFSSASCSCSGLSEAPLLEE